MQKYKQSISNNLKNEAIVNSKISYESDDHIYYNATLFNPHDSATSIPALFAEQRNSPIVNNPSDYNIAVVRFEIPTDNIPLFIFENGAYTVSLTTGVDTYAVQVPYTPITSGISQFDREVYSPQQFINGINAAYQTAYNALNAAHPGLATAAPFFRYIASERLIKLYCVSGYAAGTLDNPTIGIWMNWHCYSKIQGFWVYFEGFVPNGKDLRFFVQDQTINVEQYNGTNYIVMSQDDATNSMLTVQSIVLTTNSIPVNAESIAINNGNIGTQGASASLQILADFYPSISDFGTTIGIRSYIYNAQIYRLYPLASNIPLAKIDLKFYWQDGEGNLNNITIAPGRSINVKLLFLKKGLES